MPSKGEPFPKFGTFGTFSFTNADGKQAFFAQNPLSYIQNNQFLHLTFHE